MKGRIKVGVFSRHGGALLRGTVLKIQMVFLSLCLLISPVLQGKEIKRIIALSPSSVELLYALGLGDKIVATVERADFPKQALKIPRIGNYAGIQIEKLLALDPDLIVAWKSGNNSNDLRKIKSLGLNLVYSDPKNISAMFADLKMLGNLTGSQLQAELLVNQLDTRYQNIRRKYQFRPKVKLFYQLWHDPLQTIGPKSSIGTLIDDCGGKNVFEKADAPYPTVSIESVLVKNPKVIIIPHHSGKESEKQEIWSKWPEISAVKNKRIFVLNGDLIHRFTPRTLDGLDQLCKTIDKGRKRAKDSETIE